MSASVIASSVVALLVALFNLVLAAHWVQPGPMNRFRVAFAAAPAGLFVFAVGFSVAAQLEAYEAAEFEAVGSGGFTCFFYYVLDFLVGILNVGLFEQADFSIVLGNAAADDLFHVAEAQPDAIGRLRAQKLRNRHVLHDHLRFHSEKGYTFFEKGTRFS